MFFRKCSLTYLAIYLLLPYFVAPDTNVIHEYGPNEFATQVEELDGNFIMFYAPWCRHCTDFHPIWRELADMVNTEDSMFAIAQVDCTLHSHLCNENDITGYPTLLYFHKNNFKPVEYRGMRDLPSLTLFLSEVFNMETEAKAKIEKTSSEVKIYSGMAYLTDQNFEKYVSRGQHFIMFYVSWCKTSQETAPAWSKLAIDYANNNSVQIGKLNCMDNQITCQNFDVKEYPKILWIVNGKQMFSLTLVESMTLDEFKIFLNKMALPENHDPEKYIQKKKIIPVMRISEETFDKFMEKELVFINYYAPWCAHCKQLINTWVKLGEQFQDDIRIIIADVDCSQSHELCVQERIFQFPTLLLYQRSKVVYEQQGATHLDNLTELVQNYVQTINKQIFNLKDEL